MSDELPFIIRQANAEASVLQGLSELLLDVVEGGASVGFMSSSLSLDKAQAFWTGVFASVERGERILFVAEDAGSKRIVGTVQLIFALPDNQPHRADIAKMQVRQSSRRRGI